ncbi:MAG: hypothetical protein ACREJ5_21720 [Geminicoccaceae bacterium]
MLDRGYGHGHLGREVIETAPKVSGADLPVEEGPWRPGDPATLAAGNRRIREGLGRQPRHADLEFSVRTAWRWEQWLQACGGPDAFGAAHRGRPIAEPGAR